MKNIKFNEKGAICVALRISGFIGVTHKVEKKAIEAIHKSKDFNMKGIVKALINSIEKNLTIKEKKDNLDTYMQRLSKISGYSIKEIKKECKRKK